MMEMKAILVTVIAVCTVFAQGQNHEVWQYMCVTVHNSLRVARGLGVVSWSDVLASVADAKAINIMLRDNGVSFNVPSLTEEILGKQMITISSEIGSKTVMNFPQSDKMAEVGQKIFLALSMDDIVRRWYQNGLFYSEPEFKEKFNRLLDAAVDKIGCAIHSLRLNDTTVRMYVTVAYQRNTNLIANMESFNKKTARLHEGAINRLSSSDRACSVNCTNVGSCYSHRDSAGHVGSRIGTGEMVQLNGQNCECQPDPELSKPEVKFLVPSCKGPCFVRCPLAIDKNQESCYGDNFCTCSYTSSGAAVCD